MGSSSGDPDERPVHRVQVPSFEISKSEVTVRQYRACVEVGACPEQRGGGDCNWGRAGYEEHPINCISWHSAQRFAFWQGGRLPTEAEWEYAARDGGQTISYPWGEVAPSCERVVMSAEGMGCGEKESWPVCSKSQGNTSAGLCDMAGNLWEWVKDNYCGYKKTPKEGQAATCGSIHRVYRGGSWYDSARFLRVSNRAHGQRADRYDNLGFRVVRSIKP